MSYPVRCDLVFSAHAEVVPGLCVQGPVPQGILRARGGSSFLLPDLIMAKAYSPRTRR